MAELAGAGAVAWAQGQQVEDADGARGRVVDAGRPGASGSGPSASSKSSSSYWGPASSVKSRGSAVAKTCSSTSSSSSSSSMSSTAASGADMGPGTGPAPSRPPTGSALTGSSAPPSDSGAPGSASGCRAV